MEKYPLDSDHAEFSKMHTFYILHFPQYSSNSISKIILHYKIKLVCEFAEE